jgi:hypothetical protein
MQPICTHKISVQSSKPSHAYPIIRLPREFRRLAGAAATIYKATHNGALAFLVVPKGLKLNGHTSDLDSDVYTSLDMAEVTGPNPTEPIGFLRCFDEITGSEELFDFLFREEVT